ncbi:MAG: S-layer homology domain-containing protein, partial [Defluviitaleaceae bacterium]|nr:S-layer homology domain-containing protein [Defluviitaleaceae bacterium]
MNKNLRNIAPVCLLVFALVLPAWGSLASAASFRDVPQGHHAYEAVEWIANPANGSIMTGDANRNFNPASIVTKFEAVFIFARAAGYKTTAQTITPAER